MRLRSTTTLLSTLILVSSGALAAPEVGVDPQIAGALQAAPEDRREAATVMGHDTEGGLVVLRQGTNEIICLADKPGDDNFRVACYHESLEAYMKRGRELRQ